MADKTSIMKEAQKYLSKGQIDKAISEWEKLISSAPDGNTFNIVGDLYLKKGDKKAAVESFHRAADFFRQEGFSLKALALYKKVLNITPSDSHALYALGELSEEKGLTTDAIKYYIATADTLSKEGKKDRILEIYEKILSLSPANVPLRNKVAEILLKEGLSSDACREYIFIARIYDEKGEAERAEEYYSKVLGIQPSNKEAILGVSYLYEKAGEPDRALQQIRDALGLMPENTDLLFRCALLSLSAGGREDAKGCLCRIVELDPTHRDSRKLLSDLYLAEGLKEEAWAEILPVVDQIVLEEEYEAAIGMLEHFRDIEPLETGKRMVSLYRQLGRSESVVEELVLLGDILRERGMNEDAISCYGDALELRPDDEQLKKAISELVSGPETEDVDVAPQGEKPAEEVFIEADIFTRYGLLAEAVKLLEGLKVREPQNLEVHQRLKSLYTETADKELAVTECLILQELYRRMGQSGEADSALREALAICPEDPRLRERRYEPASEPSGVSLSESGEAESRIEDFTEDIAEADFYMRQGLTREAADILDRLQSLFPDNAGIAERLERLSDPSAIAGLSETDTEAGDVTEEPIGEQQKGEYEDLFITEKDFVDAQEMPEPVLDEDVLDIFQEFKKGLEKELGDEDSETHYNLGIAYKEMGLIDDAIKEFQTSRGDEKRYIQSSTMLGVCYMEKGLYDLAVETLRGAIARLGEGDDAYWPVKYDLAEACEKNNNTGEALALYTEVYGWNAGYRSVAEKIDRIKAKSDQTAQQDKPKEKKNRVSYL